MVLGLSPPPPPPPPLLLSMTDRLVVLALDLFSAYMESSRTRLPIQEGSLPYCFLPHLFR